MELLCAFCIQLPGRSQGSEALAWTVINGHAVCQRHYEFAYLHIVFFDALEQARAWEEEMLGGSGG